MRRVWTTIRSYILWTYSRGSVQYDVMVTLILAFIFLTPHWVNFKDRPVERMAHQTGVVVVPDGEAGFIYQVEASAIQAREDDSIRDELLRVIEPIAGEVEITHYETVHDGKGRVTAYRAWVVR